MSRFRRIVMWSTALMFCVVALVVALIPFPGRSVAQQESPKPTISGYFLVKPSPGVMSPDFPKPQPKFVKPPSYCKPCLFYGGDEDFSSKEWDGLWNGDGGDDGTITGKVLVPFTVPALYVWQVTGLFTNNQSNVDVIDPEEATWSISKDVKEGSGGITIASGTLSATYTPTGRSGYGWTEYTVLVNLDKPVWLSGGLFGARYWLTVVPRCTNSSDTKCGDALYYLSNVPDTPPLNSFGPLEPKDDSFFYSVFYGFYYYPAAGSKISTDFFRFSAGVLGSAEPL